MLDQGPPAKDHPNPLIPTRLMPFTYPLPHLSAALKKLPDPVKIIALGSSSTAGHGSVVPYPYRLEMALRQYYEYKFSADERRIINVINRGKGGEDAPGEFGRLELDVITEHPALVIWQVGTNAAWLNEDPIAVTQALTNGLERLKQEKTLDVILMDPQYTPALLTPYALRVRTEAMQILISEVADKAKVNLFGRYEMMRAWHVNEKIPLHNFVDPDDSDRLHQSDWSTQRVTWELARLITDKVGEVWKEPAVASAPAPAPADKA